MKKIVIPEGGLQGEALREAATGEYRQIQSLLQEALKQALGLGPEQWVNIHALFADRVVIPEGSGSRLFAYPYTISDKNQVELGKKQEVVPEYNPVFREAQSDIFIEALSGSKFRIRVIRAGLSGNKTFYPDAVLREATPLFDNVRVFVKSDEEHLKGKGKDFRNLIGRLTRSQFIEGQGKDSGEIQADLEVLDAAEVTPKLREAVERNMADNLFGFSIDADGKAKKKRGFREALKITKVQSVDLISEPAAGGQIIKLIEAKTEETDDVALRERMIEAVKKANNGNLPDGLDVDNDEALEVAYREALTPHNPPEAKETQDAGSGTDQPGQGGQAGTGVSAEDVDSKIRMVEARATMRVAFVKSGLPDAACKRLTAQFEGMDHFTEADVTAAINGEREYLASFTESGHVQGLGDSIEPGEDRSEKMSKMFDAFFNPDDRSVISFKECYVDFTGDTRVTGHLQNCNLTRMREAVGDIAFRESVSSGTFSNALGDAINRAVSGYYAKPGKYDDWRDLADVVPVSDFRTQERARVGGYGDLPVVAERGPYGALATPTDDISNYAVVKHGGTEDVSLEAVKNDDVGVIRRIPMQMTRAAKRTLYKFVLDFLSTNPVITDGNAVFYAGGNNLGTAALDKIAYAARRLAMMAHVEPGSNEKMDLEPAHIWVPDQLEEVAFDMFVRNTNLDPDFVQKVRAIVHRVWYWTDANNWYLSADKHESPPIEIGFLDGQEEPELFVQDSPTQGSLFSNDVITYKLRHIYGGTVKNREALDGNVVA